MPKEIVHWVVAERTADQLHGTRLGDAALSCPNALKMGAVFPDIPYYLTGDSDSARLAAAVGSAYHGTYGEDTYVLLRTLLAALSENVHPAHLAFITGVVTHLQTDMIFHPLVYFLTGNYHDADAVLRTRAIRAHRRFEGLLDWYVCRMMKKKPNHFRVADAWCGLECRTLFEWTEREQEGPELGRMLQQAVRRMVAAQRLFVYPPAACLTKLVDFFLPAAWKEVTALFYQPVSAERLEEFYGRLVYRNPVSGAWCCASVDELLEQSVKSGVVLCRRLELLLDHGETIGIDECGPSLNFNLPGADVSLARYFAIRQSR